MNRTIKFRGKTASGDWIYGSYIYTRHYISGKDLHKIIRHEYNYDDDREDVLPETVGQFIGICDKNGKEIYEGDIVLFEIVGLGRGKEEVVFTDGSFAIHNKEMGNLSFMEIDRKRYEIIEVIGNIHENKNLLKSK